jgi:hypothetical protein
MVVYTTSVWLRPVYDFVIEAFRRTIVIVDSDVQLIASVSKVLEGKTQNSVS